MMSKYVTQTYSVSPLATLLSSEQILITISIFNLMKVSILSIQDKSETAKFSTRILSSRKFANINYNLLNYNYIYDN